MYSDLLRGLRTVGDAPARAAVLIALLIVNWPAGLARADEDAQPAPPVMHFCWTNCFTLQLNHGLYTRVDGTEETWSIERFTPQLMILHRHDAPAAWNGFSADVTYTGQISDSRLINVTVGGHPVGSVQAAWGIAIDTLPGNNAERDQRSSVQIPTEPTVDAELRASAAPPPLPDYGQPPCPVDGYLWTPGYWAWREAGYFWMPGVWVAPPRLGVLWTPGYWGYAGTVYVFHPGYWGPRVGYYGGINYGFGYGGVGFAGGRWAGEAFVYNSAVSNVNGNVVRNTYRETATGSRAVNKVSFNGGPGGTTAVPTAEERAAAVETRLPATRPQRQGLQPAATPRPAVFHEPRTIAPHLSTDSPARAPRNAALVSSRVTAPAPGAVPPPIVPPPPAAPRPKASPPSIAPPPKR
jgi:hypothetical protein